MLSVVAPLFAQALTLNVSDSSELRGRLEPHPESRSLQEGDNYHWDANTQLGAALVLDAKRTSYLLSYSPSFTVLDIGAPETQYSIFHSVNAGASTRFKRTTLSLSQGFTYGTTNYRVAFTPADALPPPEPGNAGPEAGNPDERLPSQQGYLDEELETGSASTTLGLGHDLSPRASLSEYASYTYSTGFNESRDQYPEQRSYDMGVGFSYSLGMRDSLLTSLSGGVTRTAALIDPDTDLPTSGERKTTVAVLEEAWSHRFAEQAEASIGVRLNYARTEEDGELIAESLLLSLGPVGTMSFSYTWGSGGAQYTATATLGTTPYVDRFTGIADPRFYWSASLVRIKRKLTLSATVSGAQSTDSESVTPLQTVGAQLTASYEVAKRFITRAGVSGSSEMVLADELLTDQRPLPPVYYAFVGFSYSLEPMKF